MRKYGFKFFATNFFTSPELIRDCVEFASSVSDAFIELMVVPNIDEADLLKIKSLLRNLEVRIHAPHSDMGFDAGNRELESQNKKILSLSQKAADIFASETIVVHAGNGHDRKTLEETARQFKLFNDKRIVVENLPHIDNDNADLHGGLVEDIMYIMNESGCGFCFDFSHAVCAALTLNIPIEEHLRNFFALNPTIYHMCDGDTNQTKDIHLHYGEGNFPLKHFINDFTDNNAYITMETGKGLAKHKNVLINDYNYLKSLL